MPPYHLGAPLLAGGSVPILDVDFTGFAAGFHDASSFHSQAYTAPVKSDLVLLRYYSAAFSGAEGAQGETVQTSASTIMRSAVAQQIDIACVGNRTSTASKRGLVIEHNVYNHVGGSGDNANAARNLTTASWIVGLNPASHTPNYADSPDGSGSGCTRVDAGALSWSNYHRWASDRTAEYCFSAWQRSKDASSAGEMMMDMVSDAGTLGNFIVVAATNTWGRNAFSNGVTPRRYFTPVDGSTTTLIGGWPGAKHRDILVDYVNLQAGSFPTEAIPTGQSCRRGDRLNYLTGSALIAGNGQIKMFARLTPKFLSTKPVRWQPIQAGDGTDAIGWFLFSWGAVSNAISGNYPPSYAFIKGSDRKVYVKIEGGSEYVSTSAIAWAQYDEVELYIAVGNGVPSVLKYRINGGSWTDLVLATVPDAPNPGANPVAFFRNIKIEYTEILSDIDTGQLPCWLHHLTVFRSGAPAGV